MTHGISQVLGIHLDLLECAAVTQLNLYAYNLRHFVYFCCNHSVAMILLFNSGHPFKDLLKALAAFAADYPGLSVLAVILALLCMTLLARLVYVCTFDDFHMGGSWRGGRKVR